ncbi:unnamed protein product [Rhizoctonia solani]|uniref:RBR-type E3 ubiquitin transferase n=1 Tax=Rhizoctonia solani TaxID=456999 RepID=A0A8H3C698_9AGAM|nr:unnamed protein product [Rhizoctonia solani]
MTSLEQLQDEEIDALVAVYPDILTQNSVAAGKEIKLDISIELETERKFDIVSSSAVDTSSPGTEPSCSSQLHTSDSVTTTLMYLPPLLINVVLPLTYPQTKPMIQSISVRHTWLAPALVRKLAVRLDEMWTPEEGVLWQWVEDVRTGAFLESSILSHPSPNILISHLTTHQTNTKQAQFSAQTFKCGICLSIQRGVNCVQLDCLNADVFCLECLKEFWGMCVAEGEVTKVACPGMECVEAREKAKNDSGDVGHDVIGQVLNEEQVARWKRLWVKHLAEKDPSAVPCPVRRCQAPVPRPKAAEDESGWTRLRTCDSCGFAFCVACKRSWHGPNSSCAITQTKAFVEAHVVLTLPKEDPRRRALERQCGRKVLRKMAQEYRDEKENQAWLKERTTACPQCKTRVEKGEGCNYMT